MCYYLSRVGQGQCKTLICGLSAVWVRISGSIILASSCHIVLQLNIQWSNGMWTICSTLQLSKQREEGFFFFSTANLLSQGKLSLKIDRKTERFLSAKQGQHLYKNSVDLPNTHWMQSHIWLRFVVLGEIYKEGCLFHCGPADVIVKQNKWTKMSSCSFRIHPA